MKSSWEREEVVSVDSVGAKGSGRSVALEDRRGTDRLSVRLSARLVARDCPEGKPCTTADVSAEGLFVVVPTSAGIRVGERFEVLTSERAVRSHVAALLAEGCYGTVVRTEQRSEQGLPMLGVGLRFDQPLML